MKNKLFSVEEAKNLKVKNVHEMYEKYVSKSQVNFFKNFAFGNDLIIKADGSYLYTESKKIFDLTGGIGVLNHGHNNFKILEQRIKFQKEKNGSTQTIFSQYLAALSHNMLKFFLVI